MPQSKALDPAPREYAAAVMLRRRLQGLPLPMPVSAEEIESWLLTDALKADSFIELFDAFVWRLAAADLGLDRANLSAGTLHPQLIGYSWNWARADGITDEVSVSEASLNTDSYRRNPLFRVIEHGETIRRRPPTEGEKEDMPLLEELWADGFTDYLALPLNAASDMHNAITLASKRPDGFDPDSLLTLKRLLSVFALHVVWHTAAQIARNTLAAYLGDAAGAEVLQGSIHRGDGRAIRAVVWISDLRGFTSLSERLPGPDMTAILNAYFGALAEAVLAEGGEILKFIGDGILAVFPFTDAASAASAAAAAMRAATSALEGQDRLNANAELLPDVKHWRPLQSGIGIHEGDVFFGNVGAPDRLDFTVIGSAVNVASRVEALTKSLGRPVLLTADVAARLDPAAPTTPELEDLGRHVVRGVAEPVGLYALGARRPAT